MASVKKGVKYMVIILSNTNFFLTIPIVESYKKESQLTCLFYGHKYHVKMFSSQIKK